MREPSVTPGAYEVTGGGWEIFETEGDAERHINGVDYAPASDPLYWYQNGYYVAYYAKSYLGRTYSNAVPLSVGNYHDLADVMSDANKEHHMYIDHPDCDYEPKIYINDYSRSGKNGLDLFKDLYDLSVLSSPTVDNETGLITSGTFEGHKPLNNRVAAGNYLEFFLRTDIERGTQEVANPEHATNPEAPETITVTKPWTPIASSTDPCFSGTLHGDGHTISDLDNSLFGKLCGNVYNLGVTGSFNTAGVADTGDGYVESCWVKTTATTQLGTNPYPVFGDPTRSSGIQVVNSYYAQSNADLYNTGNNARGTAIQMIDDAFYNGEVAYDLNNFYLYKRYSDMQPKTGTAYKFWKQGETELQLQTGYYNNISDAKECSSGFDGIKYVEGRFTDGDFRYAEGSIPETTDERRYVDTDDNDKEYFYPIWPDDYIFFGQKLTYGWADQAHQDVPTAVVRDGGHLSLASNANRVYRAPAYYRSKVMNVAHFNPDAYLASMSKDGTKEAHPNMTAIDFAGHEEGHAPSAYKKGMNGNWFYQPLLDDDGLTSIRNCDETQTLLVYAPAAVAESGYANEQTYDVLTNYFIDPTYEDYYDNEKGYRRVSEAPFTSIRGHLVQDNFTAINDHLLVDKQDFNAPLAYHFDADHRMWYQRIPADKEYVDREKGWQGISLPFSAELVTTDTKGEITHFYSGSEPSKNDPDSKIGHEYWLRSLDGITIEAEVAKASFNYPNAGGADKTVGNTFLWDYYYKNEAVHDQKDANLDIYLEYRQFYNTARTYASYPLLTAAKPYILGLPGTTYYEFDLSGKFIAQNTAVSIDKLGKQIITFASDTQEAIAVSDDDIDAVTTANTHNGYSFKPNYMKQTIETGSNVYTLSGEGNSYNKIAAEGDDITVEAFRPYFVASPSGSRSLARRIEFNRIGNDFGEDHESEDTGNGMLTISTRPRHIIVKSTMKEPKVITITNGSGVRLTTFTINPGQTIDTNIHMPGLYIVNKTKIVVR